MTRWTRVGLRIRAAWWRFAWGLLSKLACTRLDVSGTNNIPEGPVVFAANHGSHADTVVLQLAFAGMGRTDVLAAGATDYFFRGPAMTGFSRLIGVFSFPRRGETGVFRSRAALARGWSVLIYPQGTRDGGPFRAGVARIARAAAPVVPVQLTGTCDILPKGRRLPRRAPVAITFLPATSVLPLESDASFAWRLERKIFGHTSRSVAYE